MPRIPFAQVLLSLLVLWGCASQRGQIAKPDWAQREVVWEMSGLTVNAFGENDYSLDRKDDRRAEENAIVNARKKIARELAKAYLKASGDTISEDEAASRLEGEIDNVPAKSSSYDVPSGTYWVQVYYPATALLTDISSAFGVKLKIKSDGSLSK